MKLTKKQKAALIDTLNSRHQYFMRQFDEKTACGQYLAAAGFRAMADAVTIVKEDFELYVLRS